MTSIKGGWAGTGGAGAVTGGAYGGEAMARLRAENAALQSRLAKLEPKAAEVEALRAELAEALRRNEERRRDRRALDREIVEMRSMLAEAERQLGNIRQTFIYRIGDAIVAARTWKGLRGLPRRLIALRRAYLDKRAVSGSAVATQRRMAERLRYVEDALKILAAGGLDAAVAHVRSMPDRHANEKARTLVELAQAVRHAQPGRAVALGIDAAALNPHELRLRALVLGLFDQGEVVAPATLLSALGEGLMASPADVARREVIAAHRRQLSSPIVFPPRAATIHPGAPRIAVVSPRSLPQHAEAITFRAQAVVEAAREAGHEAILVTAPGYQYPKAGDGGPVQRKMGVAEVVRLGPGDAPPEAFDSFLAETGATLTALFLRHRITHVHALAGTSLAAAALWGARRAGATFTLDVGGVPVFGDRVDAAWEASERFRSGYSLFTELVSSSDQVIVRSGAVASDLQARGLIEEPRIVEDALPPGFAPASSASVRDIRRELGLSDQRVIGVFEAIDDDEGLADLVRALPAIRRDFPDAAILFCGSGRGGQALMQLAARLDIADHVLIPSGFVRQRTPDYLSAFSVAAFPKRRDPGSGLASAFELQAALAVGAPVVAADNAWARDWIDGGQTGLTVKAGDIDGMAQAIGRILGDRALVDRLGKAGQALVHSRSRRAVIDPRILAVIADTSGRAAA
jgi:glycosyltransferase involved in cell wall biosynthesis